MTTQATPAPSATQGSDADPVSADDSDPLGAGGLQGGVLAVVALGAVVAVFVLMRRRQPPQD